MSAAVDLFDGISRRPDVVGVVLHNVDRSVRAHGDTARVKDIPEIVSTARYIFKEVEPKIRSLSFEFGDSKVLLSPLGTGILIVVARRDANLSTLCRIVGKLQENVPVRQAAIREPTSSAHPPAILPPIVTAGSIQAAAGPGAAASARGDCLEAMNRLTQACRAHLGGPVIRNYMKKAQNELTGQYPLLLKFTIDLDAKMRATEDMVDSPEQVGMALGAWARAFLVRASTIAPELSQMNVRTISAELASRIETTGFFSHEGGLGNG